jgi:superkiller protein 3
MGLALARYFSDEKEEALSTIQEAIASASESDSRATQLDLTLHHAKLLFAIQGKSGIEGVKSHLLLNIESSPEGSPVHVPSILTLAVLALASNDADLLDAAQSELESHLSTSSSSTSIDEVIRLLIAIKSLTSPNNPAALELVHNTIQSTISSREKDQRSLFRLHLVYLSHAAHLLETGVDLGEEVRSQVVAYTSLTQDLFQSCAPLFTEVEKEKPKLLVLLARLKEKLGEELGRGVQQDPETLRKLAVLDSPWSLVAPLSS